MDDRLRTLWDFDDLAAGDERFREQLVHEAADEGRADVLTQLARVRGLHGDFDAGERLVEEAAADSARRQTGVCLPLAAAADLYSGMFPCLRFGFGSRLGSTVSSAEISTGRVRRGSMTSST